MTKAEQAEAERISALVDGWLREPGDVPADLVPEESTLLGTAQQLARLPALLGPVDSEFEQRVMHCVRQAQGRPRHRGRFNPAWAVAAVAVLLLVALITPAGQTAVAGFMAVFNLGRTEVRITPAESPTSVDVTADAPSTARKDSLTLEEAQALVAFTIPQPARVPPDYRLQQVTGYSYPDLPAWLPQPFIVELNYGDGARGEFSVRLYPVVLGNGGQATVAGMNLEAAPIQEVRDVDVGGRPGVLLRLGQEGVEATWQELVWEYDELVVVLTTSTLTEGELLDVATSVR
jgi:hypothetical protein